MSPESMPSWRTYAGPNETKMNQKIGRVASMAVCVFLGFAVPSYAVSEVSEDAQRELVSQAESFRKESAEPKPKEDIQTPIVAPPQRRSRRKPPTPRSVSF